MKANIYLNFAGNTEEAFNFYKSVFGTEFRSVVRFKDMQMPGAAVPKGAEDRIAHIALPLDGQDMLLGSDSVESMVPRLVVGNNFSIMLQPDSKERAEGLFAALSAGGSVQMAMADQPWGDYYGMLTDRFGIQWMVDYQYPKREPVSAAAAEAARKL